MNREAIAKRITNYIPMNRASTERFVDSYIRHMNKGDNMGRFVSDYIVRSVRKPVRSLRVSRRVNRATRRIRRKLPRSPMPPIIESTEPNSSD